MRILARVPLSDGTPSIRGRAALLGILLLVSTRAGLGAQAGSYAAAPAHGKWTGAVDSARRLIDSIMRVNKTPGLSIAIAIGKEVVWSEGFGYASIEQMSPVTTTTRFRIGSISKPMTTTLLGRLYERGSLDLDAPIQKYVPSYPVNAKGAITARLLAGHMAGIRHYRGDENNSSRQYPTVLSGLEIFKNDTLLFAPGKGWSYTSYGYNLLSAVLEGAGKRDFLALMHDSVFRPLGMTHTVADHVDSIIVGRTAYYERTEDGHVVNAMFVNNSYKWAGGGFLSTPEDLIRMAHGYLYGAFFAPKTRELLWASMRTPDGKVTNYGMGWGVEPYKGHQMISHYGASVGGSSALLIFPDDDVVIAVAANLSQNNFADAPQRIAFMFMKSK
jgi:serine beta-lactamase-like protein LACTB, mitochondrial